MQSNFLNDTTNLKKNLNILKIKQMVQKQNVNNDNGNDGNKKHIKTNVGWF